MAEEPEKEEPPKAELVAPEGRTMVISNFDGAEMKLHAELTKKLEVEPEPQAEKVKDLVVVASNPTQMQAAQLALIGWSEGKGNEIKSRLKEVEQNLAVAIKNKWRTETLKKVVRDLKKEIDFYEKIETAIRNGYVLVPNFSEIDIFAIRTQKFRPSTQSRTVTMRAWNRSTTPHPREQETESPPVGEGRYVDADTKNRVNRWSQPQKDGSTVAMVTATPDAFQDVTFPFHLAKPQIVEKTADAMKLLVFDDVGILPGRRRSKRRGDPMVIGRIHKNKNTVVSFLITWFVDTKDI